MWLLAVFLLGYTLIALEHRLQLNKAASAILTGVTLWTLLITFFPGDLSHALIEEELIEHLGDISAILFFLLGAMTIVELIDGYDGFEVITSRIRTARKIRLLWILCLVTFFLSAILDNLTTSIVMATLLGKLIPEKRDLWLFAGFVIIAANAGGAWSPIGDVTTIMLWVGGQISAPHIVLSIFLPSLVCLIVPLGLASFFVKGNVQRRNTVVKSQPRSDSRTESNLIFLLGVGVLVFVPIFKNLTHLPPFMGILLGLGVLWLVTEFLRGRDRQNKRALLSVAETIQRIDTPTVLFFLGILLAVGALETAGHLADLSQWLDSSIGDIYVINTLIGLLSAVVDNVPLVAGAMGMYSLDLYTQDHSFWTFLAYCAGTGGSVLIIGSAAGVAIMGKLNIDFIWYLKRIAWLALVGYLSGIIVYLMLL